MKTRWLALLVGLSLSVSACKPKGDGGDADEARDALPTAEAVQIKVPAEAGSGKTLRDGQLAQFYLLTRGVSVTLNGGAAFLLGMVRIIVLFPVTSRDGDAYVWGPWTDALNPSEYRLVVTPNGDGDYEWSLEGRRKADGASAAFEAVAAGTATPGELPNRGSGAFMLDFDTAERLDPGGNDAEGQLSVTYDLSTEPRTVEMDFEGAAASFHYAYAEQATGAGDFQFVLTQDMEDEGADEETAEVRSRWLETGAGRSDFRVSGGDLGDAMLTGAECWDTSFGRVYYDDSLDWQPAEGDVASCAYAEASLPE